MLYTRIIRDRKLFLKLYFFKTIGNSSAGRTSLENEILQRCVDAIEIGELDILLDLREENPGRPIEEKFHLFWDALEKYVNQITAEDHQRRDNVAHLSAFISIR